jgi:mycothiol synthase
MTSRSYESETDLQQMQALLMEGRRTTNDWRYWHVGDLMWNFFMVDCHLNRHEHIRLWDDERGKLAAYAVLSEDSTLDCQVLPGYEGSGIEAEALDWAETRLGDLRIANHKRWSEPLTSWARQDDVKQIAFLEQHGFSYSGEHAEVNLLRWLDEPLPEPALPAGFRVRSVDADKDEISRRAAAQRRVWQPWTVGEVSDEDYARLMCLPGYDQELDVVAVAPDGAIAAYVNGWIDPVNRIGDFGPLGALPAYRRQGLARAALLESLRRMKERGMVRVCISTGVSNTPALRLYESVGFIIVNKTDDYVKME